MQEDIIFPYIKTCRSTEEYMHHPYWKVILSNGQVVYSDANRRSWMELKSYLQVNPYQYIVKLEFGFRDNTEVVHSGEVDYFFTNSIIADYSGWTQKHFIGGYRDGNIIKCKKYIIPEIYLYEQYERTLEDDSVKRGLIERIYYE